MEAERSPFSINLVEVLVAIVTAIIIWFGLHASIFSFWPVGFDPNLPLPDWVVGKRAILFSEWAIPIIIVLTLSSIFLVHGIQNQNIKYFSRLDHFVLAWPLVLFPSITILYTFSLFCFPIGLMLSLISIIDLFQSRKYLGSAFVIIWIVGCTILAGYYFGRIDYLFGD